MSENMFPVNISSMEPIMPQKEISLLKERAADLMRSATALNHSVHPKTAASVKDLLRSMNSYYSNLIEGQSTHPLKIEDALKKNYEKDPAKKNLQILAVAHIRTQREAEKRLIENPNTEITNIEFLKFLHKEFYLELPEVFLEIENGRKVIPGEIRLEEVEVGQHLPPYSEELLRFLERFRFVYSDQSMDPLTRIVAIAASHHRLAWIHPFLDGNGRVIRLFSDCFFMKEKIGGFGLWTISRGLARKKQDYYQHLAAGDMPRQDDLDGRGALSDSALSNFCKFFLETALDQVDFMSKMLELSTFENRLQRLIDTLVDLTSSEVRPESFFLLREIFLRGEIARGEVDRITGLHERVARNVVAGLIKYQLIKSETPKSELQLNFNPIFAQFMFPSLYPESLEVTDFLKFRN